MRIPDSAGLIELLEIAESTVALGPILRTAPVRGALEHFYRAGVSTQIAQTALDLDQQGYDEVVALMGSITERAEDPGAVRGPRREGISRGTQDARHGSDGDARQSRRLARLACYRRRAPG